MAQTGTLQSGARATLSVAWLQSNGQSAPVDGPTTWVSSNPSVCQCTVASGNSLIANLYAPGPIGTVQIQASADADMGEGMQPVTSVMDITVIAGQATGGDITLTPTA
jgi:hypothetical protein